MKKLANLTALAWKQLYRHPTRSALTLLGVATGMFLFTAVETMQGALGRATDAGAGETELIVYRENRFCPFTSRLPEHYLSEIKRIPGVADAIPVQVVVNNCGASLDVVAFRGVPPGELASFAPGLRIVDGSFDAWEKRSDGAMIGANFARRRGLRTGDSFDAAGITVNVSGIVESGTAAQDNKRGLRPPAIPATVVARRARRGHPVQRESNIGRTP